MPGPSDADSNTPSMASCQNLEPNNSRQLLTEEPLQDVRQIMTCSQLENVINERGSFRSQGRGPHLEDTNPVFPIMRSFLDHPGITPMMPEHHQRYSKRPKVTSDSINLKTPLSVEMWTNQQIKPRPPFGWEETVHPEGGRYFFNPTKRTYTDADLYNLDHFRKAMSDLDIIEGFMANNGIALPEYCQLVFDLFMTGEKIKTKYYFVNHQRRSIFFLDPYAVKPWFDTPGQLGHDIEAQYWYHLNIYPDSSKFSVPIATPTTLLSYHPTMAMIDLRNSQSVEFNGGTYTHWQTNNVYKINTYTQKTPWDQLQFASVPSAFHDSGRDFDAPKFYPDNFTVVMDDLRNCVSQGGNITHPRVISLSGSQATTRSAILRSLCEECFASGLLLASFFFNRFDPSRNNHEGFVATVAYQICSNLPKQYRHFILDVIEDDPLVFTRSIETQFNVLIISPIQNLIKAEGFEMGPRRLVVIDKLDECLPTAAKVKILTIVQDATKRQLLPFVFVITSGPEHAIQTCFKSSELGPLLHQIDMTPFCSPPPSPSLDDDTTLLDIPATSVLWCVLSPEIFDYSYLYLSTLNRQCAHGSVT